MCGWSLSGVPDRRLGSPRGGAGRGVGPRASRNKQGLAGPRPGSPNSHGRAAEAWVPLVPETPLGSLPLAPGAPTTVWLSPRVWGKVGTPICLYSFPPDEASCPSAAQGKKGKGGLSGPQFTCL